MDQTYQCNKDRPNGTAAGVSLRKGAFLQEHLTASRRKQPAFNPFMESYPMKQYPPHYIDQYARKIFPLLFGLFNIVYWSYYLPRRWRQNGKHWRWLIYGDHRRRQNEDLVTMALTSETELEEWKRKHERAKRGRKSFSCSREELC